MRYQPYDPTVLLAGIHPKEMKNYAHTETYKRMFITALFILVPNWKQPRCQTEI